MLWCCAAPEGNDFTEIPAVVVSEHNGVMDSGDKEEPADLDLVLGPGGLAALSSDPVQSQPAVAVPIPEDAKPDAADPPPSAKTADASTAASSSAPPPPAIPPPPAYDSKRPPTVDIVFRTPDGKDLVVTFEKGRSLGVNFLRQLPITISEVREPAQSLGVQLEWMIVGVGGYNFENEKSFDKAFAKFKKLTNHERDVEAIFVTPSGKETTVHFTKGMPLGVDFMKKMPITVTRVKEPASSLGVEPGYVFKTIGSTDLWNLTNFDEAWPLFEQEINVNA